MPTVQPKKNFHKTAIALACSAALLSPSVFGAPSSVEGRITDENNTVYFEGAKIQLKELKLTAVSDRDGTFRFNNIPEGVYTLSIEYIGASTIEREVTVVDGKITQQNYAISSSNSNMENVIVYGQRAGQAGAINRQKNASNLKSVVSADAIGQLPDQNAAEALQRLPGMLIKRDQGEGRFVSIRGIDPNLNNVSINGVNVPSPESGVRSVAMDVIPSELVQSLEVSKTVTPDMDASAVGGSIEVKSLSAFDREGKSYSFTAQGSYNEQTEDYSPKLSGSFSDTFALSSGYQLGVATAVSWFERTFGSHNAETDGGWANYELDDANTGNEVEIFGAEEVEQRHYQITRERLGAALNFDLHTSSADKYYLRTLYSQFSDDEYRQRNEYKFAKGNVDLNSVTNSSAQFVDADMDRDTKDRYEEQDILSFVVGGENQLNDWLIEYSAGYSKSTEREPDRVDASFAAKDLTLGYISSGPYPQLTQSAAAHQLSNFELDSVEYANNLTEDEEISVRIDLSKDFVFNNYNGEFKFGAKYQNRDKFSRVNLAVYDGGFNDVTAQAFGANSPDYGLGDFGPGLSQSAVHSYVMSNISQFEKNELDSSIDTAGQSYQSSEDILSAYAMITLDIEKWHIVTGLRYEGTTFETQGNKVELTVDDVNGDDTVNITPWLVDKDYNHILPSLNIRYDASDKLVARFALTQTIARPSFGNSAAYQIIETEVAQDDGVIETERKAEVGNPELNPYESNNVDFSIEYYPGHIGVLSAGLFYKDIDNFIIQQEVQDNGDWDGFDEVIQHVNGGSASLTGIELAWNKNFQSGLMLGANGTFIDADDKLPNQADTIANIIVGFENNHFSTRLSANYTSENYQFDDGDSAVYEDTHMQIDFSAKYYISQNMQVYFNAVNLTNEPYYLYHGQQNFNYQYEEYGSSFELGFTITSL
ncbi:TonB-dependent receptor [Colwellia sp. D2M02]|uniref:TonB-dependent receptor n=1 Tax=Colwellia sp. D2M02 TaxID=2841562 RepID=UPI001C08E224|nr:TonB-dependent receptor [Colwellia sp. D2M02]MBU2894984.1 TonB-dependent receptor [Colwellia sp. D2M02]